MAIRNSDKIKAIIFLLVSGCLMLLILLSLVGTQWMKSKDTYYIAFSDSLGGLSTGASVRFHGIRVGKVVHMDIDMANQMGCITVEVAHNTPIKTDSIATIEVESFVTGTRYVQITPGSVGADLLPANDPDFKIPCIKSGFQKFANNIVNLGSQAPALATNLTAMFSQQNAQAISTIVQQQVPVLLDHVNAFFASQNAVMVSSILSRVDTLIASNSVIFSETVASFNKTTTLMSDILSENRETTQKLLTNLESASRRADNLLAENGAAVSNAILELRGGIGEARDFLKDNRQSVSEAIDGLGSAVRQMEEFLRTINRQPSVLIYGKEEEKEDWADEN